MIRKMVAELIRRYGTNNPYAIAERRNIVIFFEPLGDMFGFFNEVRRIKMIHINDAITEQEQRFTCAHELGHELLHQGINTPFLRRHTLQSVDKIEREANQLAVELLIPDELLRDGVPIYEAAARCGVPEELAELKQRPKRSLWRDESSFFSF